MTISNDTRSVEYTGTAPGSFGPFAVPFKVFDESHLVVTKTDTADPPVTTTLVLNTDYSFDGEGEAQGELTLLLAQLEDDEVLSIRRAPPLTQELSIRNQGPYLPAVMEDRLDLMVMQVQGVVDDTQAQLDGFAAELAAFDTRLDAVEEQIQELIDAQLQAQAGAALPVPFLLNAAAEDINDDGATLRWAVGLSWEIDIATDEEFASMVTGFPQEFIDPGTELRQLLSGLEPDTPYFARLRAIRGVTRSEDSNTITFTTEPLFLVDSSADLVTFDGVYSRHYFYTPGAHTLEVVEGSRSVEVELVGAGGMGGGVNGSGVSCGGGGGGGKRKITTDALAVGVYDITVGAAATVAAANNVGVNGGNSMFEDEVALGGGFGGSTGGVVGNGGTGGGAPNSAGGPEVAGDGTTGQGYDGGIGGDVGNDGGNGGGGGGGGTSETGTDGSATSGGKGGDGVELELADDQTLYHVDLRLPKSTVVGAGGGGARPVDAFGVIADTTPGAGGTGGGGAGANAAGSGAAGTGFGSGGGGAIGNNKGGNGTDGIVIVKHRGRALNVTPEPEIEDPPVAMWRGPITMLSQVIDGVTVDVIHAEVGPGAGEFTSTDNPVLGQQHSPEEPNRFDLGFPYPAYYAANYIGFKFSHEIRRFRITHKNANGAVIRSQIFAADQIMPDAYNVQDGKVFYGDGMAANGGVAHSGSKYLKNFGIGADDRQEVAWVSNDSFKAAIVRQNQAAWGDGSGGWPDAMATVPDVYYEAYFLLASDPEVAGEDTWEP